VAVADRMAHFRTEETFVIVLNTVSELDLGGDFGGVRAGGGCCVGDGENLRR